MTKPFLIDNRKFDIRGFIFFTSFFPAVAFYYPGYIRKSVFDYEENNYDYLLAHLINADI